MREDLGLRRGELGVAIGGPPCQGFSSIRPHRSTNNNDPRNQLFRSFVACVDEFRPPVFVMENVVGLATHGGGADIEGIAHSFEAIGYATDWRILNAAHFGVPQRRERLVMIGVEGGGEIPWPEPTHESDHPTIGFRERHRLLRPETLPLFSNGSELEPAVTVMDAIGDLPNIEAGQETTVYDRPPSTKYQRARRRRCKVLTWHSSTRHTDRMLQIIRHSGRNINSIPEHLITSGFSSCYSRLDGDEPSVTITVNFVHPASNRCIHPIADRALTPREGARLQSFNDSFRFVGTRTQIVKQIGNAVPPLLGTAVARAVARVLA